jgi:hypothetical protein
VQALLACLAILRGFLTELREALFALVVVPMLQLKPSWFVLVFKQ